jgi:sugar (pentulose or hexulose) kinase
MDYEFEGLSEIAPDYAAMRPPYSETLSPELPLGLNQGRQIAWQRLKFPQSFARAKFYLTYPQYWAWRMCGVAASEATLLGAHSDLWNPRARGLSSLAAKLDLRRLTPPLRPASDRLGPVRSEFAVATGLDPATEVLSGLHDTNASLLPHLASRKAPFAIVSTGTWVILMAPGLGLENLREADDMLANVDVEMRPVACARFMGGREYGAIVGDERGQPDEASLERVIASSALALPCFAPQGGPFVNRKGEIRGDVRPADRPGLATLYVALMSDLMLSKLGADLGDVIVEGGFAANPAFCGLLAALRPTQRLWAGDDAAGAARGAALLARWPANDLAIAHQRIVAPLAIDGLSAYRSAWLHALG